MAAAVIAHSWTSRYSHLHTTRAGEMADELSRGDGRAALEERVKADEWLRPGDVAKLLDVSRSTVVRRIKAGEIGVRYKPRSSYRVCNPVDVRQLLDETRREHRGTDPAGS